MFMKKKHTSSVHIKLNGLPCRVEVVLDDFTVRDRDTILALNHHERVRLAEESVLLGQLDASAVKTVEEGGGLHEYAKEVILSAPNPIDILQRKFLVQCGVESIPPKGTFVDPTPLVQPIPCVFVRT